jgi:hypothetical protein
MNDGRQFTDYRPNCYVNNLLRYNNRTMSSYEYRQFLINNGSELMKINNLYSVEKNGCSPCNAEQVDNKTVCAYNQEYGECKVNNPSGLGLTNRAVQEQDMIKNPNNPGLQHPTEINMGHLSNNNSVGQHNIEQNGIGGYNI